MRVRYLQHVGFEGPAAVAEWADERGHGFDGVRVDEGEPFPDPERTDLLVVLGGPMGVYDTAEYPWLEAETEYLADAVGETTVLGICLGAQLLAAALGADVYEADVDEIGWFPVETVSREGPFGALPETHTPLHWHGDTFELPAGATRTAESEAVRNQAFVAADGRAVGLQFHLEATPDSASDLLAGSDLDGGEWVQPPAGIRDGDFAAANEHLFSFLDSLAGGEGET
jgi:GMP synthase-like glutamine amidotransferase